MAVGAARRRRPAMSASTAEVHEHEHDYSGLLHAVAGSYDRRSQSGTLPLFRTNAPDLNQVYLDNLPAAERQLHSCSACRAFLRRYGNLVTVGDDGTLVPIMWDPGVAPAFYRPVFEALDRAVRHGGISGVFRSSDEVWGTPVTGTWTHLAVKPPPHAIHRKGGTRTAGQEEANVAERYRTVAAALADFRAPLLDAALRALHADAITRAEKFLQPVAWLRMLQDRPRGRAGANLLWRAVALAPEGYCHPRASVVGSLLEDLAANRPFEEVRRRFNAKVAPTRYQRPQAAPTAGNVARAERVFEQLGLARSLERRFARLADLEPHLLWTPRVLAQPVDSGLFSHLKTRDAADAVTLNLPASVLTWRKFAETVLPAADQLEILVPALGNFIALTTAVYEDAPPILRWDREDERNPVAWYVYPKGSSAAQWGLAPGSWVPLTGVAPLPTLWGSRPAPHLGEGVVLLIAGARDQLNESSALFPECLRDELHEVRSTIEAYSRGASLAGGAEASACGYDVRKQAAKAGQGICRLRGLVSGGWVPYQLDRWD